MIDRSLSFLTFSIGYSSLFKVDATTDVFGRVFYSIRSLVDHGAVKNPALMSKEADRTEQLLLDDHEVIERILKKF